MSYDEFIRYITTGAISVNLILFGFFAKYFMGKITRLEDCVTKLKITSRVKDIDLASALSKLTVEIEFLKNQIPRNLDRDLGMIIQKTNSIEEKLSDLTDQQRINDNKTNERIIRLEDKIISV